MKTHGPLDTHAEHSYRSSLMLAGYVFALVSGAAALVYEVLWVRRFVSLFGATAPAASATLSALFLGLAAGSLVVGRRSARWRRPLRAYGVLELCVALGALLVIPALGLYERVYPAIYNGSFNHPLVFVAVKTALATAALFVPAFLMGGTLPLLAHAFVASREEFGKTGSVIYAANTFGAVAGALAVPFLLLPSLGAEKSYFAAVAANLCVGALAILLDRSHGDARGEAAGEARRAETRKRVDVRDARAKPPRTKPAWVLSAAAFLSGALVLALEVLWARMLAQVHENSVYSFAIVLAIFLAGLAAGAALARVLLARGWNVRRALGLAWVSAGVLVFATPLLFYSLTGGLSYANEFGADANLLTLAFAAATMLAPTALAGVILPLLMEVTAGERAGSAGPMLGRLLAFNTAGSVVGPLVATYAVLPWLGLWAGVALAGLLMVASGEAWLGGLFEGRPAALRRAAVFALLVALFVGANPLTLPRARVRRGGDEKLIHLDEGSHAIVSVLESADDRWMLLNNFYTLGGTASANEERQQARIPLMLHPSPRRVAFLGMGTGITAGGALLPNVERVVALELVPEVVKTAGDYFAESNLGLLKDGRVEVVNEDARVYLKASGQRFDVIVGDLVVPWRSGESSLFTREHFNAARAALAPGGVFCQWLPMHQLTEEQFAIIAATFLDVFPRATLWRGDFLTDAPALALVGHTDGGAIDPSAVDSAVQQLKPSTASTTPVLSARGGLWLFLVGPLDPADPQFASARRNTEGEPWIELLSPSNNLSSKGRTSPPFAGEALLRFMEKVRAAPLGDSPLRNLTPEHQRFREAGAILWEASLLLSQGREAQADALAADALAALPAELRDIIGGPARHDADEPTHTPPRTR
ncbi:MAG TPA: fused MFS/spermidine synthase [Pyrinomonadaceae bacterium]|nr:fused MFS/spermidine synthase [Pyrinomonadaceae bacterium]